MTSGSGSTPTTDEHGEERTERGRRGRLLFVGAAPGREIRDRLRQTPAHARNLFEAIGEVTTSDSRHPIFAVVIDANALPSSGARASMRCAGSIPRCASSASSTDNSPRARHDGFDDVLDAPLDCESLRTLIGPEWITPAPAVTPADMPTMPTMPAALPRPQRLAGRRPRRRRDAAQDTASDAAHRCAVPRHGGPPPTSGPGHPNRRPARSRPRRTNSATRTSSMRC